MEHLKNKIMTKSKVGAKPKKQRVRHAITKSEGIHEGIHRDEYGYYDSSYHCYCFAYGYFFHRGKGLEEKADNFVVCEKHHGYIPQLYCFEDKYAIDWIGDEGDSLHYINGITPEQAIRNAFKWCLDKGLITNSTYIK